MEYLALDQVRERVAACRAELEALLAEWEEISHSIEANR